MDLEKIYSQTNIEINLNNYRITSSNLKSNISMNKKNKNSIPKNHIDK